MSLAVSSLTSSSTAGASVASAVTASVSPAANSLLVLWVSAYNGASTQVFTVSGVSGLGLTWAKAKLWFAGSANKGDVECWTAVCGASPGSGAVTATFSSTFAGGAVWDVDQVTGQDAAAPVVASNTIAANASSTAPSATFAAAASPQNLFISGITGLVGTGTSQTVTPNESPAWTQLANTASSTAGQNGVVICTQVSPDVTHLVTSATLGSSGSWGVIGLEIAASAAGAGGAAPPPLVVPSLAAIQASTW